MDISLPVCTVLVTVVSIIQFTTVREKKKKVKYVTFFIVPLSFEGYTKYDFHCSFIP